MQRTGRKVNNMLLIYYNTKDGNKGWIKAEKQEHIDEFIQEHPEIADYEVTCTESDYRHLKYDVSALNDTLNKIKDIAEGSTR